MRSRLHYKPYHLIDICLMMTQLYRTEGEGVFTNSPLFGPPYLKKKHTKLKQSIKSCVSSSLSSWQLPPLTNKPPFYYEYFSSIFQNLLARPQVCTRAKRITHFQGLVNLFLKRTDSVVVCATCKTIFKVIPNYQFLKLLGAFHSRNGWSNGATLNSGKWKVFLRHPDEKN